MPAVEKIRIPHLFTPRDYQLSIMGQVPKLKKRGAYVWHRRAGKDRSAWNKVVSEALQVVANYHYYFPTYTQGKKVIWDAIDPRTGIKFLDHIPSQFLAKKNDTEMMITLTNGSTIQIIGTDKFNAIMGTPPIGCVFSEYSLQDPKAWDLIRPILRENGGWAIFVFTYRGRNHAWHLMQMAKGNPDWFAEELTIDQTHRDDGSPVISSADVEADRREGMDEALIRQEYYCSPDGYIQGAYYAKQIQLAREEKRIGFFPHDPRMEVYTFWDLGIDDSMTIWFMQAIGKERRMIDYYENVGHGFGHYAKILKEKPYVYAEHLMPHDAAVREMGTNDIAMPRKEAAESLGIKPIKIISRSKNMDMIVNVHIPAVREFLSQCTFDENKCARGLSALEGYHSEYDEDKKILSSRPTHDWTSHGADGFRTGAIGFEEAESEDKPVGAMMSHRGGGGWNGG